MPSRSIERNTQPWAGRTVSEAPLGQAAVQLGERRLLYLLHQAGQRQPRGLSIWGSRLRLGGRSVAVGLICDCTHSVDLDDFVRCPYELIRKLDKVT